MPGDDEEVVLPFPSALESIGLATEVRSTLIASSIASLRRHNLHDRYMRELSAEHRDAVLSSVAGQWLPMAIGRAHYQACDRLGLSVLEQVEIGAEVSFKIHETFLGVVVRMARDVGVTPWMLLTRGNQMYSRLFRGGGGVRVIERGPKEARADVAGLSLLDIPYFRHALRGLYQAAVSLFCLQSYVHEVARDGGPTRIALRISWA
ncbi:MAG TPA: hypothetical protein VIF15_07500 [Polyangiaceae bacterium]|jgi:hypothetical protein